MSIVADRALAAYADHQRQRDEERQERERIRKAEEAEADGRALAAAAAHPWIAANLPDVEWALVERRFPQSTYVISPVDDPALRIIVTLNHNDHCLLASELAPGKPPAWLVGADRCYTLADLGDAIDRRRRRATSEASPSDSGAS